MLLTREEMTFNFGGARFDVTRDKEILRWIFSQSLFGEATGCYCGAALYGAPDIDAATFLSKQAAEEFSHFKQFLRIFQILGTRPSPPHSIMRFLTTHETLWDHHVTLEMAIGEGLVLTAFYALIDTIDHPEIVKILTTIARQEAGHVEFGEQRAIKALEGHPWRRRQLLGLNILSLLAARQLGKFVAYRYSTSHPVLGHMPAFIEHTIATSEVRLQRLGILTGRLADISPFRKAVLIAEGVLARTFRRFVEREKPKIPTNYLQDPIINAVLDRAQPGHDTA